MSIRPFHSTTSLDGNEHVLITGGCGFIGSNLAHRILSSGERVVVLDNFSRPGVEQNYEWLKSHHGDAIQICHDDTRDSAAVSAAVENANAVFHFAAQVAVTTSLELPREDFEINAVGTLNVLEALRNLRNPPPLIYTSTNKVYGEMANMELRVKDQRYEPVDDYIYEWGINESQRLDFYSPYGCSKGTADSYILDYARIYDLPTVVFRMSCIYGPRQFGTEDQGWLAHFLIQAIEDETLTLYGDGRQVRDVLYIDDLVDAFLMARAHASAIRGQVFNVGGGPCNTVSLLELLAIIEKIEGRLPRVEWDQWRMGDQRYFVSDTTKFRKATGWIPQVSVEDGVRRLHEWLKHTRHLSAIELV